MAREKATIFEVGPRDGLQNERTLVPLAHKIEFIEGLVRAGVRNLELGAFVRPDRVPQMADTDLIYKQINNHSLKFGKARAWALVPNRKGMERALAAGAQNIALFTAATDSFAQKNIGMSIEESLKEFQEVIALARGARGKKIRVRGYISSAFGCPFEGRVDSRKPIRVAEKLRKLGVDEISVGDTIGVGTPVQVEAVLGPIMKLFGPEAPQLVAGHFHDTRGQGLANCLRALETGVRVFDSSAGGLGGCPFAPGATGNVATEDLVYMLHGMGFQTGIRLDELCHASLRMMQRMVRPISSRYLQSFLSESME